jgi:hypothetical protein
MLSELTQWFTPAIVILGFLFTARTIRNPRVEVESRMESRLAARIDGLESQNSDLRDRMGRIEGTLDVLREFFVGTGRGTVA